MIPALALALLLSAEPAHERTSYARVLAWTASAKAVDEYTSARAIRLGAREWNPLTQSTGERSAAALAVTALASWGFYEIEQRPGWRWRLPRYVFVAAHVVVAILNIRAGRAASEAP